MQVPFFYSENISLSNEIIVLDEDTARHCVQVLRMKKGEQVQLTDGRGLLLTTEIIDDHKKSARVRILSAFNSEPPGRRITISISLIKNSNRFEWFLEKATEIGVNHIIPLLCERTEKQHFRSSRMKNILVSAMLQSRQVWMPGLEEPLSFADCIQRSTQGQKFIAHCLEEEKGTLSGTVNKELDAIILIGPEGDFTKKEVEQAVNNHFTAVTLGKTRLRTETAGVVAAVLLT